ncbi:MAG: segregation/condensation protein A [Chloroflexi bacterium]|nr:segregation/condensation protein A [Chloroflexota bacterium]MBI3732756.1 segregation/condensation protein A [Chloroflexota bacterium]
MTTSAATAYTIRLPDFEGPLDLLLHLIEREQLDITRLSLAQVTNQYIRYLDAMPSANPTPIAEFLVVAAKLLLLKSQLLLPPESVTSGELADDASDDLTQQLLIYRQFKQIAQQLKAWEGQGRRAYARIAPQPRAVPKLDLSNATPSHLAQWAKSLLDAQRAAPIGNVVAPLVVRISDKMQELQQRLSADGHVSFQTWLGLAATQLETVVSFLAVLELIKQGQIQVMQVELFGDITIELAPPTGDPAASAATIESPFEPPSEPMLETATSSQ